MTAKQKVIKYLALAFAVFLITAFALGAFEIMTSLLGIEVTKTVGTNYLYTFEISDDVNTLEINISAADLKITQGENFCVYTDNENINCTENGNSVKINDEKKLNVVSDGEVIIEIPEGKNLEKVKLTAGAGEVTVKHLTVDKLNVNFGAGDAAFSELFVNNFASVNCAAGEFTVREGAINDLNMELAVGDVSLACSLTGKTEIDCGIGDIGIKLPEDISNYSIEVDKGVCSATLNGEQMEDEKVYGDGANRIEIDGAIGDIDIKTGN